MRSEGENYIVIYNESNIYNSGYSSGYNWKIRKKTTLPNCPYINNHITGTQLKIWREGFYDGLLKSYNLISPTTETYQWWKMEHNYPNKRLSAMTEVMALQIVLDLAKQHLSCNDEKPICDQNPDDEDKNLKAIEIIEHMIVKLYEWEKK